MTTLSNCPECNNPPSLKTIGTTTPMYGFYCRVHFEGDPHPVEGIENAVAQWESYVAGVATPSLLVESRLLALAVDEYFEDEGTVDRMQLDDHVTKVLRLTGI